ncbi:MAG: O-antigen ligase family protein [Cellulophaga sp.]
MKYLIYDKKRAVLPFLLALLPILTVFAPAFIVPIVIGLLVSAFLMEKNKFKNLKLKRAYLIPYIVFVLICIALTFISRDHSISVKRLERYISLILLPIIIFSSDFSLSRIKLFFRVFVIVLLLISFYSLGRLIWFSYAFSDWIEVMRVANKNNTYLQFKYPHLMWDVHPSYWSYLMILGNIILLNNKYFKNVFKQKYAILFIVIFDVNLLYLAARVPVLINFIIHFLVFGYVFRKNKWKLAMISSITLMVVIISYFQLPFLKYKVLHIWSDERFFLWKVGMERIRENYFILGEGFGLSHDFFKRTLTLLDDPRLGYKGYEIHNQYLMALLESGLLGLFSLLYVYITPLVKYTNKQIVTSKPLVSLLILVLFGSCIEPFFSILKGIVLFSVFSSIFMVFHLKKEAKN